MQLEALQRLPKAEAHIHLGGSFTIESLLEMESDDDDKRALIAFRDRVQQGVKYNDVFEGFRIIERIVDSDKKVEEGTFRLCRRLLETDGVTQAEIRTGLKSYGGPGNEESYLKAVLFGIERANYVATVLLSVRRNSTKETVQKTVELAKAYMPKGVVGIEISGDSTKGDIRQHIEALKGAKACGLKLSVHMGEDARETDQMLILEELEPDRIDHGVNLVPEAFTWIKQRRIPVSVCPTSARLCNMHGPNDVHPWVKEFQESRHPMVVGCDDRAVFNDPLPGEYMQLAKYLTPDDITELAKTSFTYLFPRIL